MTNQEAYDIMENELRCVRKASKNRCDRDCGKCSLVIEDVKIIDAYKFVLKMLKGEKS